MINWIDLLVFEIIRWIVFCSEVYLAKRVYHIIQSKTQFRKRVAQLRLLTTPVSASRFPPPNTLSVTAGPQKTESLHIATLLMLREALPSPQGNQWRGIATGTFVVSIFAVVFLMMNYLFRPIVNQLTLSLLPLWIPLVVLPLPYLLEMKPPRTLLFLLGGLGLSLLMLFIFGV